MAIKAFVPNIQGAGNGDGGFGYNCSFVDTSTNTALPIFNDYLVFGVDVTTYTVAEIQSVMASHIMSYATGQGYSITANDIAWTTPNLITPAQATAAIAASQPRVFTNNASHTIQTVAAAANGFQLSTTRDAIVNYSTTIVTAATLAAGAVGSIVLEVAATNSSSAGAWQEIGRLTNGQVFSLAAAIGCTQTVSGQVGGVVPASYYARLRSINTTGTPTYTYNSGQEILL